MIKRWCSLPLESNTWSVRLVNDQRPKASFKSEYPPPPHPLPRPPPGSYLEVDRAIVEQPQVAMLHARPLDAVMLQDGVVKLRGGLGQPPPWITYTHTHTRRNSTNKIKLSCKSSGKTRGVTLARVTRGGCSDGVDAPDWTTQRSGGFQQPRPCDAVML